MGTVRDLIHQSAMLAGMRASGEVLEATLAQDLLTVLNQLIESWNVERLMIYQIERRLFPLQASKQLYTVGPGGDYNMTRPVMVQSVSWRDEAQSPALELPMTQLTQEEYEGLRVRATPSAIPDAYYYDPAYPLACLFFYPNPNQSKRVVLYVWHPWSFANTLDTVVAMPPGYERMLVHNLAVEVGQQPGARLNQATMQIAMESKYWLQTINARVPVLGTEYPRSSRGRFNFYLVDG